jgi:hypothetical protein
MVVYVAIRYMLAHGTRGDVGVEWLQDTTGRSAVDADLPRVTVMLDMRMRLPMSWARGWLPAVPA